MLRIYVTLTALTAVVSHRLLRPPPKDERGSVTIENVLWAVAVIAIVAIVVAAIRAYVTAESGRLR
jgi:heme/copper-type cytochrome/quinol oxidase subunit 2